MFWFTLIWYLIGNVFKKMVFLLHIVSHVINNSVFLINFMLNVSYLCLKTSNMHMNIVHSYRSSYTSCDLYPIMNTASFCCCMYVTYILFISLKKYIVHTVLHYRLKLLQSKYLLFRQARRYNKNTYNLYELNDLSNMIKLSETESYKSPDVQITDDFTGIHFFKKRMNE